MDASAIMRVDSTDGVHVHVSAHEPGGCLLVRADLSTSGPFTAWTAADAAWVPSKRLQFDSGGVEPRALSTSPRSCSAAVRWRWMP